MKKYFFLLTSLVVSLMFLAVSCRRCYVNYEFDTYRQFFVQNAAGNNLLDPTHPNYINVDSVFMYCLSSDGCEVKLYNDGFNNRPGYYLDSIQNSLCVDLGKLGNYVHKHNDGTIVVDCVEDTQEATLLIKWDLHDVNVDTIRTIFVSEETITVEGCTNWSFYYKDIYINGVKIYDRNDNNLNNEHSTFVVD